MKNLSLVGLEIDSVNSSLKPETCCVVNKNLYFTAEHKIYKIDNNKPVCHVFQLPVKSAHPVYMESYNSFELIVLCMATGELISIKTNVAESAEIVGCIDPGILAAEWSPTEEHLAVVTTTHSLVFLGQDLDPLFECNLQKEGEESFVTVGWGKAETQFRGTAGKLIIRENKDKVKTDDDGAVRLSWRGDGAMVAVSLLSNGQRHLKVVNCEGHILNNMENLPGVESSLSWKPSGALIATTLRENNKRFIAFYEKNLLRHGGFEFKEDCAVNELLWNSDSTILALILNGMTKIQLFCVGNYHWYHKFTIPIPENHTAQYITWDKDDAYVLIIVSIDGEKIIYSRYSFTWSIARSSGASNNDQAMVAVVDGKQLLLTNFRKGIVPPPMSTICISYDHPINSVNFLQFGGEDDNYSSNDFFIQTTSNLLIVYRYKEGTYVKANSVQCERLLFQISWVACDKLIASSISPNGDTQLVFIDLKSNDGPSKVIKLDQPLIAARRKSGEDRVTLFFSTHNTVIDLDGNELQKEFGKCSGRYLGLELRSALYSLNSSHVLMADGVTLANHVTSFCITATHLLATTMQHKILCWRLSDLQTVLSERTIERGARIITHIGGSSSVVLQLPRGNLEVIQPRALTICTLQNMLNVSDFRKAFTIMRRERINLNLLHDHNPENFVLNIKRFVADVADPILMCNFIAELCEENVTKTLYSSFYKVAGVEFEGKVGAICSLLLSSLDDPHQLLPKLSCLVKKRDVEGALMLIKIIREAEQRGEVSAVSSEEGLAHVLYIVDIEELFKVALGTYDLGLVMFIAGKSQKDPKEYIPFLSNLQKMEENYQKFTIDNFLKRYRKALGHLSLCSSYLKECLDYVTKHGLYLDALRLFARGTDTWKSVSVLYGAELTRLSRHHEAGIILERAGENILAGHAFARAGDWGRQLACAQVQALSEDQKSTLYASIVESLRNNRRFSELARFFFDYTNDVASGIDALVLAQELDEAIRQSVLLGHPQLVESNVKPGALAAAADYQQVLYTALNELNTNLARLKEIEAKRDSDPLHDWNDTASESSRGSSQSSSRLSTRSAKNTRKLERNLMKKGGVFENVALTAAIHDISTRVVCAKDPIRRLNLTLLSLGEEQVAANLQKNLAEAVRRVEVVVKEVWSAPEGDVAQTSHSVVTALNGNQRQLPKPVQALQPKVAFPPDLCSGVEWRLEILESAA